MPQEQPIRLVLVDDHPLFREGLRSAFNKSARFEIAGEAGNCESALELVLSAKPDVAVVDLNLPGANGFDLIQALRSKKSKTRVVILTMLKEEQILNTALNLNINGFVLKENASAEIIECIEAVAAGKSYISAALTDFILRRRSRTEVLARQKPGLEDLTTAERRILKRIAEGKTSKQIATEFFISPRTVESHRANICEKLNLSGSNSLLQFAIQHRDALSHIS